MADRVGYTTSNGIDIDREQRQAITELVLRYHIVSDNVTFDCEGQFGIWAEDSLKILPLVNGEADWDAEDVSDQFFEELRHLLKPGQELIVQCIDHIRLRFPFGAWQFRVTPEAVVHTTLNQ